MKVSWPQVALLSVYVMGAILSLVVGQEAGKPIAYMFAGAAANTSVIGMVNGRRSNNTSQK